MANTSTGRRRPKILITDTVWPSTQPERVVLAELDADIVESDSPDEARLKELARDVDGILTCFAKVTEKVVRASPRLRVVGRYGVGTDNIDVATCTSLNIPVTYVPDYAIEEVADHAFALALSLLRKTVALDRLVKAGTWQIDPVRPIRRLRGLTLGILGYGRIGHALGLRAMPHGFKILVFDPYITPERLQDIGAELVSKDRLIAESDVISCHAPLTPETRHIVGEPELRGMKKSAFLVNTARGPLVDEYALARALREGWIAGAGVDVLAQEPPPPDHPLIGLPNAIITPHAAFLSEESVLELERRAALAVVRVLQGRMPEYVWNREVLGRIHLRED
ncbi:MAG: C-terminal binding protein [Actinobacteria bacterium]|nr:C-terminal binding protein [Actinomycetota bacterium]